MAYIAERPESYAGMVVGNGQCVAYVRTASRAPETAQWREGVRVKGGIVAVNSAIATFQNGRYNNHTDGRSHAAVFTAETRDGLQVWDQWVGRPVNERLIRFRNGATTPNNDGDAYSVVE